MRKEKSIELSVGWGFFFEGWWFARFSTRPLYRYLIGRYKTLAAILKWADTGSLMQREGESPSASVKYSLFLSVGNNARTFIYKYTSSYFFPAFFFFFSFVFFLFSLIYIFTHTRLFFLPPFYPPFSGRISVTRYVKNSISILTDDGPNSKHVVFLVFIILSSFYFLHLFRFNYFFSH